MTTSDGQRGNPADDGETDVGDEVDETDPDAVGDDPDPVAEPGANRWSWPKRILVGVAATMAVILLVVGVMVVWPASTGGLGSDPDPTASYEDAIDRFETLTADEPGVVYEPCRSRLLDQGERSAAVVVLFHGLTNGPSLPPAVRRVRSRRRGPRRRRHGSRARRQWPGRSSRSLR